jgi:hypothetical protein
MAENPPLAEMVNCPVVFLPHATTVPLLLRAKLCD